MQLPGISSPHLLKLDQFKSEIDVAVAMKLIQQWTNSAELEMWSQFSLAKLERPVQRSLQNLRQSVIKEHAWSHLFTDAVKFICLEIMKCFPVLDEELKAWVQHRTVGNNQLATEFSLCHWILCLMQESSELLLRSCMWANWRQARHERWFSCGHPKSKQED